MPGTRAADAAVMGSAPHRHPSAEGRGLRLVPGVDVRAGQIIGSKYRVEELLGAGASAIVVAAKHVWLRHAVTMKIFTAYTEGQTEALDKQIAKARVALRLKNPHVGRILDIGTTNDRLPFVATERLEGHTLDAELDRRERLPYREAVAYVLEACEGLAEAHALGLVHGDLKPANLFLCVPTRKRRALLGDPSTPSAASGEQGAEAQAAKAPRVVKVLDFGTGSPLDRGDASASAWFASPAYVSPEQIKDPGAVDARTDIWALGVILHEMISGSLPFTADTVSGMLVSVVMDTPSLVTDAPYELAKLIHRCLEKDPKDRPRTVAELARALAPYATDDGKAQASRVNTVLSTPPEDGDADADASGSIAPVSIPVPDVTSNPRSAPTRPSLRAIHAGDARRRANDDARAERSRTMARVAIGAAIGVAAFAFVVVPLLGDEPPTPRADASPGETANAILTDDDPRVAYAPPTYEPPAFVPPSDDAAVRESAAVESLPSSPLPSSPRTTLRIDPRPESRETSRPAYGSVGGAPPILRTYPTVTAPSGVSPTRPIAGDASTRSPTAIRLPAGLPSVRAPLSGVPVPKDKPGSRGRANDRALPGREERPTFARR